MSAIKKIIFPLIITSFLLSSCQGGGGEEEDSKIHLYSIPSGVSEYEDASVTVNGVKLPLLE